MEEQSIWTALSTLVPKDYVIDEAHYVRWVLLVSIHSASLSRHNSPASEGFADWPSGAGGRGEGGSQPILACRRRPVGPDLQHRESADGGVQGTHDVSVSLSLFIPLV